MRRSFLVFTSIILTLIISSCTSAGDKIEPIKTEVILYDFNTATQIIKKGEKIIADIAIKDSVSRQEYKQFLCDMDDTYDGYEEVQWKFMFFYNNEIEDEEISILHLYLNSSILIIREEYLGDDSKLEDWNREYLYQKNGEGEWVFYAFGGEVNLSEEDFIFDYLELK